MIDQEVWYAIDEIALANKHHLELRDAAPSAEVDRKLDIVEDWLKAAIAGLIEHVQAGAKITEPA